ncbi:MAG: hypothetical protein WDM80_10155 [Limisphaerales bacterium]
MSHSFHQWRDSSHSVLSDIKIAGTRWMTHHWIAPKATVPDHPGITTTAGRQRFSAGMDGRHQFTHRLGLFFKQRQPFKAIRPQYGVPAINFILLENFNQRDGQHFACGPEAGKMIRPHPVKQDGNPPVFFTVQVHADIF